MFAAGCRAARQALPGRRVEGGKILAAQVEARDGPEQDQQDDEDKRDFSQEVIRQRAAMHVPSERNASRRRGCVRAWISSPELAQPFSHARLPAWARRFPAFDDVSRQTQRDQLARVRRRRSSAFIDLRAAEHLLGEFGKVFVLLGLDRVSIDASQIGLQGTARRRPVRVHWLFSCQTHGDPRHAAGNPRLPSVLQEGRSKSRVLHSCSYRSLQVVHTDPAPRSIPSVTRGSTSATRPAGSCTPRLALKMAILWMQPPCRRTVMVCADDCIYAIVFT